MFAFVPYDVSKAGAYLKKSLEYIDKSNCYKGIKLYADLDSFSIKKVFEEAIRNNVEIHQDHTKVIPGKIYMVLWCDEETGTERGLSLFYCEGAGGWFSKATAKTLIEQLQIRFDSTRYSAGVSRHTAEYLRDLVDKGVADRAVGGGSSNDAKLVKNAFEKTGYKTTYEFMYEK